jgi:hypothetical protein
MNLIPQSKFKDLAGITKQAVSQLVKNGTVTAVKKGRYPQIDLDGALTQQYLAEKQSTQQDQTADGVQSQPATGFNDKRSFEIQKIQEQTEEIRIKNSIKRGDLVEKKLIKKVFDRLYSIDQQQVKPLGVNVSPKISAVYNIGNTEKTLQILELIKKQDDPELKSEIGRILNAGEPDRINEINQIVEDATGNVLENVQREINKFLENIEK